MMKKEKETELLRQFIEIFCREKHHQTTLCAECSELLAYATKKRDLCPYKPKPKCKHCQTHCYAPAYRAKIKEVMKFSGMYLVKRGRLDLVVGYLF
jgi:hypothetical protein